MHSIAGQQWEFALVSRTVAVAVVSLCTAGVGFFAIFGRADPDRLDLTAVSRIRISAEAIVSGKLVSGEWTVPAIRHWDVPAYWLQGGTGSFRTVRSPFDTFFMRLPTGEGIGVDLMEARFDMTWTWQPVASPIERGRAVYYLLDSIDRPRVLIDYAIGAQSGTDCPKEDLIFDCKVSSRMTVLEAGPFEVPTGVGGSGLFAQRDGYRRYNELRRFGLEPPKPRIFVNVGANLYDSSVFRDDPGLQQSLQTITRPTIAWIDYPSVDRRQKWGKSTYVELAYDGLSTWSLDEAKSPFPRPLGPRKTAHLTESLTPDDLECCRWPDTAVKKERITSILSAIKYQGEVIPYGPVPTSNDKTPILIDPAREIMAYLFAPNAKVIWVLPSK